MAGIYNNIAQQFKVNDAFTFNYNYVVDIYEYVEYLQPGTQ